MSKLAASVRAEFLKGRRAAPFRVALIAPLPFCLIGLSIAWATCSAGCQGTVQFSTYGWNYWYVLMLPIAVALLCAAIANEDKHLGMRGVLGLPLPVKNTWWAKVVYALTLTLCANCVVLIVACVAAAMEGNAAYALASVAVPLVLTVSVAWMVPACLMLTQRFGTLAGIVVPSLLDLVLGVMFASNNLWWALPMSAGMRVASPFIGVAPSGIPLEAGDPMWAISPQWFLALVLCAAVFVVLAVLGARWYSKREAA